MLHLDRHDQYGADWASLSLEEFLSWIAELSPRETSSIAVYSCPSLERRQGAELLSSRDYNIDLAHKVKLTLC